jgi:hypothetical protein
MLQLAGRTEATASLLEEKPNQPPGPSSGSERAAQSQEHSSPTPANARETGLRQ